MGKSGLAFADASREQSSSISDVSSQIEALSSQSTELRTMLSEFEVSEQHIAETLTDEQSE